MKKEIREWVSGGKRDTDEGKLDIEGFLSPVVLKRYAQYMDKHRTMRDGSKRESDNWQKGFGESLHEHFCICIKSLFRHFMDLWTIHRREPDGINHYEETEESLCAIMFNAMALLHRLLKNKNDFDKQEYIDDIKSIPGRKVGELE